MTTKFDVTGTNNKVIATFKVKRAKTESKKNTNSFYYSWRTKKNDGIFSALVYKVMPRNTRNKNGTYCDSELLITKNFTTRARAKSWAQKNLKSFTKLYGSI